MNILNYYRKFIEKSRSFSVKRLSNRRIDLFLLAVTAVVLAFIAVRQVSRTVDKPQRVNVSLSSECERLFGKDTVNALIEEFEEQHPDMHIQVTGREESDIVFFNDGEFSSLIKTLPLVSFMDLFFYNIDILQAANCDRPPKTRAEFLAAARAVAGSNRQVSPLALGLSLMDPQALRRDLYPWIWTDGGEVYTEGDTGPVLSRAAADAITFLGQLHREGLLAPGTFEKTGLMRLEEFAAGKIAMMTASERDIAFLRQNAHGVNFGITAMPAAAQRKNRLGLSGIYAGISSSCALPEEAWVVLAFIAEKSQVLAAALGAVPGSFPNAFPGEYIEEDPLYSKAWDIFEAADIVEYNGDRDSGAAVNRIIREKLAEALQ